MPGTKNYGGAAAGRRDSYMELVRRLPLKTIKSDEEHERATGVISELMGRSSIPGRGITWMRCWCS